MKAWIVYNHERLVKNQAFADKLLKAFKNRGIDAELKIFDSIDDIDGSMPEIVIQRTTNKEVTAFFEQKGVYIQNNLHTCEITNDKYQTYLYLSSKGIPMVPTQMIHIDNYADKKLQFPLIAKSLDGHGGSEVFYTNNLDDIKNAFEKSQKETLIVQPVTGDFGKDLRVYVIKNKIICAMLRSSSTNFKSNFSLGGLASIYKLNNQEKELVLKIASYFDFGLVGIDFLIKNNQLILNEIEDVVGCRMVYQYTNIDIVKEYISFILDDYSKTNG